MIDEALDLTVCRRPGWAVMEREWISVEIMNPLLWYWWLDSLLRKPLRLYFLKVIRHTHQGWGGRGRWPWAWFLLVSQTSLLSSAAAINVKPVIEVAGRADCVSRLPIRHHHSRKRCLVCQTDRGGSFCLIFKDDPSLHAVWVLSLHENLSEEDVSNKPSEEKAEGSCFLHDQNTFDKYIYIYIWTNEQEVVRGLFRPHTITE